MNISNLITAIDAEILRLEQARQLLGAHNRTARRKPTLSREARARISAAQKRRWAKQKGLAKR